MPLSDVHTCHCSYCQQETLHPDQELHQQMNLLLSRLDEQQRRWYVAVESNRIGPGGDRLLSQITGLDRYGLTVVVCHYPTGCSKWNPIEHRLFSYIRLNWAGCPLRSFDILLNYLRGTTTRAGLTVRAALEHRSSNHVWGSSTKNQRSGK